jgi:hypothetical protein
MSSRLRQAYVADGSAHPSGANETPDRPFWWGEAPERPQRMRKATDVLLPRTLLGQWTRRAVGALPPARRAHWPSTALCITETQFLRERSKDVREPRPTGRDHFGSRYQRMSGAGCDVGLA